MITLVYATQSTLGSVAGAPDSAESSLVGRAGHWQCGAGARPDCSYGGATLASQSPKPQVLFAATFGANAANEWGAPARRPARGSGVSASSGSVPTGSEVRYPQPENPAAPSALKRSLTGKGSRVRALNDRFLALMRDAAPSRSTR